METFVKRKTGHKRLLTNAKSGMDTQFLGPQLFHLQSCPI